MLLPQSMKSTRERVLETICNSIEEVNLTATIDAENFDDLQYYWIRIETKIECTGKVEELGLLEFEFNGPNFTVKVSNTEERSYAHYLPDYHCTGEWSALPEIVTLGITTTAEREELITHMCEEIARMSES